jgi:hypothetical protein
MNHFKFEWNKESATISFDGDFLSFASNLSAYLISAEESGNQRDKMEAKNIVVALSVAVESYKTMSKKTQKSTL